MSILTCLNDSWITYGIVYGHTTVNVVSAIQLKSRGEVGRENFLTPGGPPLDAFYLLLCF